MATIVCQGLEPMTLRLKLSTPKPHSNSLELTFKSEPKTHNKQPEDVSGGGWSFLQALAPPGNNCIEKGKEEVYVHPMAKRILSDKSLAMCTESLGSETGSDEMVSDFDTLLSMSTSTSTSLKEKTRTKTRKQSNLPPPLTTISGPECLRIRARREDGRMVMEAVKSQACFLSERSHGRLRLYFLENSTPEMDPQRDLCEYAQEYATQDKESENDTTVIDEEEFKQREEQEEEETEVGDEETKLGGEGVLDMDGNDLKFEGKMGIEKCQRDRMPRRCMEGEIENRKSLNWEPFWVATS